MRVRISSLRLIRVCPKEYPWLWSGWFMWNWFFSFKFYGTNFFLVTKWKYQYIITMENIKTEILFSWKLDFHFAFHNFPFACNASFFDTLKNLYFPSYLIQFLLFAYHFLIIWYIAYFIEECLFLLSNFNLKINGGQIVALIG